MSTEVDRLTIEADPDLTALWNDPNALHRVRDSLLDDKRWIESQLADADRRGIDGNRLVGHEYWAWRGRAVAAMTHKSQLSLKIKGRIRELEQASFTARKDVDDPLALAYQNAVATMRYLRTLLDERDGK